MTESNSIAVDLFGILRFLRRNVAILIVAVLVAAALAAVGLMIKPFGYRATVELLTNPQPLQIVGRDILPTSVSGSIDIANVDSQPALITSAALLRKLVVDLDLQNDPQFTPRVRLTGEDDITSAVESLRKALIVERVGQSLVFRVGILHRRPERAAEIVNSIAQRYLDLVAVARQANTRAAIETLETQAKDLRRQVDAAEKAVEDYRAANNLISNATNSLVVDQQIGDLYSQISAARTELARLEARLANRNAPIDAADDTENGPNSMMSMLRTQKTRLALEEARLARTLGPQHPSYLEAVRQREAADQLLTDERERLLERTRRDRDKTAALLAGLTRQAAKLGDSQKSSNAAQVDLRALERDAAAVRLVYEDTLKRVKELKQQLELPNTNARIISRAEPPTRSEAPPLPLIGAATLLFGLLGGVAVAHLRERFGARAEPASQPAPVVEVAEDRPRPLAAVAEDEPPPIAVAAEEDPPMEPVEAAAAVDDPPEAIAEALGTELLATFPRVRGRSPRGAGRSGRASRLGDLGLRLLVTLGKKRPATILLVAFDEDVGATDLGRDLGETLAGFGAETSYFRPVSTARAAHRFVVETFEAETERNVVGGRETQRRKGRRSDTLSIVDLGRSLGEDDTLQLLRSADQIVVVAASARAPGGRIDDLRDRLGGALAKVVGVVVVGGLEPARGR